MTVLTAKALDELLNYLEKSINNLAEDAFNNLEVEGGIQGTLNFLENQFDIRLENLLSAKGSGTHHLESRMKNTAIQRKQIIFEKFQSSTAIRETHQDRFSQKRLLDFFQEPLSFFCPLILPQTFFVFQSNNIFHQ